MVNLLRFEFLIADRVKHRGGCQSVSSQYSEYCPCKKKTNLRRVVVV